MSNAVNKTAHAFSKENLQNLLNQRFFYAPAFDIYGGCAGLYDYGPPGSALQANIIAEWRKHFIVEEGMYELDTTIMTPAPVFETSGHVARFADWMVKDTKTGDVLRADHLVKNVLQARLDSNDDARAPAPADKKAAKKKNAPVKLEDDVVAAYESILAQLDNYSGPELGELCKTHKIANPETGNDVSDPVEFNLMFGASIGPTGHIPGYLRPETAQGHFLNFQRLYEFNNRRIPFASAAIGRSFRNEISPRAGLLRVREFTMAEIEHFVDPLNKDHTRFDEVRDTVLSLLPRDVQTQGSTQIVKMPIGEAVDKGIVANQTLGYFLARISIFLLKIGINPDRLRFRQHMGNEMAHYATDCWDAEIQNSFGWTECVGCADRAAYDLSVHAKKTGANLSATEQLKEPIFTDEWVAEINKKTFGKHFGRDTGAVQQALLELPQAELMAAQAGLEHGPVKIPGPGFKTFEITKDLVTISMRTKKESVRTYTPNVIEPSFGLGRILYCLLEHSYWAREGEDAKRGVLSFNALVAPTKVLIVPLSSNAELAPLVTDVSAKLRRAGIHARVDDSSASIGRRYARNDELGTPYGVTIDFASVHKGTMTLRERDTMKQRIGPIDEVIAVVTELIEGSLDWDTACERLPEYSGQQDV
ncbi:glycyl-tRNA synthetase [Exidia glandulosa HHB12029]|uniref:glycine--tRNA ligase n=1 Tax=Exidia glandulosa HHB12029 TaxID=1314781 RepID=A0A165B5B6_EXIGL|nr:glycyl-tRNA synthetase [Exidia glandulosa HHB12029]